MDIISALQIAIAQLIGPSAIFYALLAIGLNLHFGYAGLLNFGQIAFALLGGYGVGIMAVNYDQPLWLGAIIGIAAAGMLAVVLGLPTLRLRADYLAIVTIAASEILRLVFRSTSTDDFTRSTNGIYGYAGSFFSISPFDNGKQYSFLGVKFLGGDLWSMVVGWIVVGLLCVMVYLLVRSPWGRVLKAVREDEDAARIAAEDAQSDAESAVTQLAEIKDRLTRLRAELHELETQEADARKAEKSTDRESRRLARVLDDARTRTAELERTVDELGG